MDNELICAIWLTLIYGIANPGVNNAIEKYGNAVNAHSRLYDFSSEDHACLPPDIKEKIRKTDSKEAEKILEACMKNNIGTMLYCEDNYPEMLKHIYNPPAVLYYKGDVSTLSKRVCFSVVGTRTPQPYSIKVTSALVRDIAACGIDVVSGFAVGIDIAAHKAAVRGGGKTYAVIGCGINYNYPQENFIYREQIIENGAFISEYPPDSKPSLFSFSPRNRIISGLSVGTAVIEGGMKSGSLITARHCVNQGKTVFVVPPADIFDLRYGGNVSLIRDGAVPVMSVRDILFEYYPKYGDKLNEMAEKLWNHGSFVIHDINRKKAPVSDNVKDTRTEEQPPKKAKSKKKSSTSEAAPEKTATEAAVDIKQDNSGLADFSELSGIQKKIAEIIMNMARPVLADELAAMTGESIDDILVTLTDMEIDGIITCGAGNTVYLSSKE